MKAKLLSVMVLVAIGYLCTGQERLGRDPFLDEVQYRSFLYFWELTNPLNGLTPDRAPTPSFSSIAAVGFALGSYAVGVEQHFISREEAVKRVLATLKFLWNAPQGDTPQGVSGYQGFFYHFLDVDTGLRYEKVELSSIDTALLMAGVLYCYSYFDRDEPAEREIRHFAQMLYERVQWDWFVIRPPLLSMGWTPESGFLPYDWQGYNEAMILYILALGSDTHPISPKAWEKWTATYRWGEFHGQEHVNFSPLFGHQYSHIWIDFRGIQDAFMRRRGIDYFENSRRAVLANRAYCIANPGHWEGYSQDVWGLTACDGIGENGFYGYWARGASLLETNDDGTIAPTAAGGSIPFAPEVCIPALKNMCAIHGDRLFGKYGFYDAFNASYPRHGWYDRDYLGIDNGPIVLMIENHYTGLLWEVMGKNPYIRKGLHRAGFSGGWLP